MKAQQFRITSRIRPATGHKFELAGERDMNPNTKTTKGTKGNPVAKIVGGLVLGTMLTIAVPLQAGISYGDSPVSPLTASPSYAEQRLADSLEERMEVQRIRAETLVTTNQRSRDPDYSEMRVADSLEEHMELQRLRAETLVTTNSRSRDPDYSEERVADSLEERREVQRHRAGS